MTESLKILSDTNVEYMVKDYSHGDAPEMF